jgi:hypothetical protein
MVNRLVMLWFVVAALLTRTPTSQWALIVQDEAGQRYQVTLDGTLQVLAPVEESSIATPAPRTSIQSRLPFRPLFAPISVAAPGLTWAEDYLYAITGPADPIVNLYALVGDEARQLTDVAALFPDFSPPILSASAEFIVARPGHESFLYRARLRDGQGEDHNGVFLYDPATDDSLAMPFFGKAPVWSPDGMRLAGSRLDERDGLYHLWISDLETGHETPLATGCNPQWSPDGVWLAYEGHDSSQWQNYTDCFSNGQVVAINVVTAQVIPIAVPMAQGSVRLVMWQDLAAD